MTSPTPNDDEQQLQNYIGNFHKSLPHDDCGLVIRDHYTSFRDSCLAIGDGNPGRIEELPFGECDKDSRSPAKFTNPLAGAASETCGLDPKDEEMPPAPAILSASSAAEMVELYWMALLRDIPLAELREHPLVEDAVTGLNTAFNQALNQDHGSDGGLHLGRDLPEDGNVLDIRPQTLFGCGLLGEDKGPLVSQFFLRDIPYGVQGISTRQTPYAAGENYLTTFDDWLCAQNTGADQFGRGYGQCNYYGDQADGRANYYALGVKRHISTIRDLARFVNRDALHQSYFNAALFLDAIGANADPGNPYHRLERQEAFGTLGGPDLLTLVSEVASRALKLVWRQKWLVHRRCRPEAFGGLLEVQETGNHHGEKMDFSIGEIVAGSTAAERVNSQCGSFLLPMAFSAGSPNHPAYGAGHATVAGACVTVLKAWFDENQSLRAAIEGARRKEPDGFQGLLQPGPHMTGEQYADPTTYHGDHDLTVGGELNKLASNVAMGRSMGGVHWRSDNTRSLRLGEKLAIEMLRNRVGEYAETPVSFTFTTFDRETCVIE